MGALTEASAPGSSWVGPLRRLRDRGLSQTAMSTFPEVANPSVIPRGWRGFGMVPGRAHGVGSGALGPVHPHTSYSHRGTGARRRLQSGSSYCLAAGPELCPIQTLFLAPKGRGKERKERSCCSQWNPCLERIPGPAGPEKAVTVGSKDPALKRSWQGAAAQGSWGESTDGVPQPFTHIRYSLIATTHRATEAQHPGSHHSR